MRVFLCVLVMFHQTSGMENKHPHNLFISHNSTEAEERYGFCKPRETLVQVEHEFPEMMHKGLVPPFVSVQRCGGCCQDEALVCVSVTEHTTTMQLMQYPKNVPGGIINELAFVEHSRCQCRFRGKL